MGWGSKPATKFHTLEKAVLERDKNTNMRRQNRYISVSYTHLTLPTT